VGGEPGGTSGSIHGLGYLFSALRREGLIADELVLQLATFLRSLDLFLELTGLSRELSQPIRFGVAASRAQMVPSFRAFIPVPSIHGTNGGKPQHMAPSSSESREVRQHLLPDTEIFSGGSFIETSLRN
jgi:hypothetical protein